jgi:hypothetical protein
LTCALLLAVGTPIPAVLLLIREEYNWRDYGEKVNGTRESGAAAIRRGIRHLRRIERRYAARSA